MALVLCWHWNQQNNDEYPQIVMKWTRIQYQMKILQMSSSQNHLTRVRSLDGALCLHFQMKWPNHPGSQNQNRKMEAFDPLPDFVTRFTPDFELIAESNSGLAITFTSFRCGGTSPEVSWLQPIQRRSGMFPTYWKRIRIFMRLLPLQPWRKSLSTSSRW